ncbi:unnamed protein product [Hydatigera taeniaeformis]|uniref:Ion_trans domain-containing protein n=1 Tax=Hydatigena taeniaeformis TaxID=6205 RepID=A0A0R3WYQ8_HYDTA|nr:unnamed protein product [Hydatigera taeniaeformis]
MADDIILEPKLIAREYLRKWFTLDIISSLPLDYILLAFDNGTEQIAQAGQALKIFRLAKLLSLLRLFRLSRLLRYVGEWEKVSPGYQMLLMFVVFHFFQHAAGQKLSSLSVGF